MYGRTHRYELVDWQYLRRLGDHQLVPHRGEDDLRSKDHMQKCVAVPNEHSPVFADLGEHYLEASPRT
jgi:hypothetical protein